MLSKSACARRSRSEKLKFGLEADLVLGRRVLGRRLRFGAGAASASASRLARGRVLFSPRPCTLGSSRYHHLLEQLGVAEEGVEGGVEEVCCSWRSSMTAASAARTSSCVPGRPLPPRRWRRAHGPAPTAMPVSRRMREKWIRFSASMSFRCLPAGVHQGGGASVLRPALAGDHRARPPQASSTPHSVVTALGTANRGRRPQAPPPPLHPRSLTPQRKRMPPTWWAGGRVCLRRPLFAVPRRRTDGACSVDEVMAAWLGGPESGPERAERPPAALAGLREGPSHQSSKARAFNSSRILAVSPPPCAQCRPGT